MLTQTINLLASARPNLGAAGQGRCTPAAGGRARPNQCWGGQLLGAPTSRTRRRCSGRLGVKARGAGGGAPEAGEDGVEEEEDGEEADAMSMGIREPREAGAGQGGSRPRSGGRRPWTGGVAGVRASTDFGRPATAENPVGQRTGGAAEGGGRGG
jgi:hypothetical protein